MILRRASRALVCASLVSLGALSVPAAAQQIDRIIVFGDSYADIGNALRLAGVSPISTGVYTTGRFSGGSNYIDTLADLLQVQQYNFAIGGARTNNGNQTAGVPGFTFEVQEFLAGGGTLGFPTVNTTVTRSDLVAVSIGGNDARAYQQGSGTLAGAPAAAATAVTSFQQNFDLVMQHGTPTISFLAGDTGRLPEIATNPAGAAVRTGYSTAFNGGAQNGLAGYSARGAGGLRLYIVGDASSHDTPVGAETMAAQIRGGGVTVGAEYGLPGGMIGIAGNYSRPKLRFNDFSSRVTDRSWQVGAYGSLSADGFFGQAYAGYGDDRDRITRTGVVSGMTAKPNGSHVLAGAKGGYLMNLGGLQAGPILALDYAHAKVDAYTETGDPALTLSVGSQSLNDLSGEAGVELRGTLAGLHPFLDVTAEHNFASNGRLISFAQVSAPVIVNHWRSEEHTSELQSPCNLVCRLLLEKKKKMNT